MYGISMYTLIKELQTENRPALANIFDKGRRITTSLATSTIQRQMLRLMFDNTVVFAEEQSE